MTLRTPENAALICTRVAENVTRRHIAAELGCSAGSISDWLNSDAEFAAQYARAMELRVDRMAEEIQEISDDGTNDWIQREIGDGETVTVVDHEHIQRSKLRVDTRKWLMSKMMPKKYGDRTTLAGDPENPLVHEHRTVAERQAEARAMLDETFGKKPE